MTIRNSELMDNEQGLFLILGLLTIRLGGSLAFVLGEDIESTTAKGATFYAFADSSNVPVASISIADVTDDPTERDVTLLQPADLPALDELLSAATRSDLAKTNRELTDWSPSQLAESHCGRSLVTNYVYRTNGVDHQAINVRFTCMGRKIQIVGGYDLAKKDVVATPIVEMIQSVRPAVLRELLKTHCGLEVPISGGRGDTLSDPIRIDTESPNLVSSIQMTVLWCLYGHLGYHWRVINRERMEPANPEIERLICEVVYPKEDQVIMEQHAHYFDITTCQLDGGVEAPPCTIGLGTPIPMALPCQIGWLHFHGLTNYEELQPGLGVSAAYGAPGTKATIYVYDKGLPVIDHIQTPGVFSEEIDSTLHEYFVQNPGATPLAVSDHQNWVFRSFAVGADYSVVMLSTCNNKFIKVRVTLADTADRYVFDYMMQSLAVLAALVPPSCTTH